MEIEWEAKRKELTDELARIESLLCTAYDRYVCDSGLAYRDYKCTCFRYLEKSLPLPSTVPVTVKLSVPEKSFVADSVIVKPNETYGRCDATCRYITVALVEWIKY